MKNAKHSFKLYLVFLLSFGLMMGIMSIMSITAYAESRISERSYVNSAGEDMGTKTCMHVNSEQTKWSEKNGTDGWYALTTTWLFKNTIYVDGTVNLILCDSPNGTFSLIADKGIILNPGSHLIIWAQEKGTGKIQAYGTEYHAGIGGDFMSPETGSLTVNGGNIIVGGGKCAPGLGSCGSDSGVITVNGGRVDATGRSSDDGKYTAPGIGASNMPGSGSETICGTMNHIYLNGGSTTANRTGNCPPIGDCENKTGCIHINDYMKLDKARLDENGRLVSYYLGWVTVKPKEDAGPAYNVNTSFDEELGTVETSASVAHKGEEITVTATAEAECHLISINVIDGNGIEIPVTDGKFTMPSSSVAVNVTFKRDYNKVLFNPSEHITVTSDKEMAKEGSTVTLTVTSEMGYGLKSLTVTDSDNQPIDVRDSIEGPDKYEFTMPDDDVTVSTEFEELPQELRAYINGAEYGHYEIKVDGGDWVEVSADKANVIPDIPTDTTVTVRFEPASEGRIGKCYLEDLVGHEKNLYNDITDNVCSFTMPGETTSIVTYFEYKNAPETVSYIDENGEEQSVEAIVLTENDKEEYHTGPLYIYTPLGNESKESWYVVKDDVNYYHNEQFPRNIELTGDVNIIVADDATFTVQGEITGSSLGGSLSIFGQTKGTGKIEVPSVKSSMDVVSAELSAESIDNSKVNVNGGKLTVSGDMECENLIITSGVTNISDPTAWVWSSLILGCADENDSIYIDGFASDHTIGEAKIADNQTLVDLNDSSKQYSGSLSIDGLNNISHRKLMRLFGEHNHEFTYSAEGDTITATCSMTDTDCPLQYRRAKMRIEAPTELTYDGNEKAAKVTCDTDDIDIPGITYVGSGNTTYEASETAPVKAGTYIASISLGEGDAATASVEYTIEPKSVNITGLNIESKVYDGTVNATATGGKVEDKVESDDVNIRAGEAIFEDANAGENKNVSFSGYSLSGEDAGNYILATQPAGVKANINKRNITIKASDQIVGKDGDIDQDVDQTTVSSETKLVNGHSIAEITLIPSSTETVTTDGTITPKDAIIKDSSGVDVTKNYNISYEDGTLTVIPSQKEETPYTTFMATGENTGTLYGLIEGGEYEVFGAISSTAFTASGTSQELTNVFAGTLIIIKKGDGANTSDSEAQEIELTKADAPTGLDKTDCSTVSRNDGTITGVSASMEYKESDGEWMDCSGDTISGLAPGNYLVRVKAEGAMLASNPQGISITVLEQVAAPVFNPTSGTYKDAQNVTISCETSEADIYYTTDGSEPTTESTKYEGAISVLKTTTIKAFAVKDGMTDSEVVTAEYIISNSAPSQKTNIENSEVSGIKAKTWTGKALIQKPVVKLSGKTLQSGTDYTVTYMNNKNVGKATLTIKGMGIYTGTITKTFEINPKGTSITKLKKARKAVTVKWKKCSKKMSKSRITGYQIQLATNKKFTKGKKLVTVKGYKKVSKKVTKLRGGKKYYVRVRTYKKVGGKKYYSKWSKIKQVKTR